MKLLLVNIQEKMKKKKRFKESLFRIDSVAFSPSVKKSISFPTIELQFSILRRGSAGNINFLFCPQESFLPSSAFHYKQLERKIFRHKFRIHNQHKSQVRNGQTKERQENKRNSVQNRRA